MGEVWLAKATGYGGFTKTVVLKTLLPELASDPLFVELLAREAKTCSKLSHPNLIEVFDFTKHDDVHLLAMEHVVGQPLNAIMKAAHGRGEGLPPWFALRVAWECCLGVQYAHEQGVIHCDLSPSNVMVTYTGTTKVLDFGVAHASAQGPRTDRLKGKYSYMAPERIKTRATDRRTDIYALGVMLYQVFTGQLPFVGESDAELFYKITHEKLVAPSVHVDIDPWIEQVILRALHPDPERRHQTMMDVVAALTPCIEGQLGTYGQQHVAAYLAMLFEPRSITAEPPPMPRVPPPPPPPPRAYADEDWDDGAEIEIDLDTAPHAIPPGVHDKPTAQVRAPVRASAPPPPPPGRGALGSDRMPVLPMPGPRGAAPGRPIMAAFAQATPPHEPKTSVQALFGDRPSVVGAASTPVSGLFSRGTRDDLEPVAHPFTAAVLPASAPEPEPSFAFESEPDLEIEIEHPAPVETTPPFEPSDPRDRGQGAFGAYSMRRPSRDVVWPWPTSRTKSD